MISVGIDVGGMSIKCGVVKDGIILSKKTFVTNRNSAIDIQNIVKTVNELLDGGNLTVKDISGIGLGLPGLVNSKEKTVKILPNVNWQDVNLSRELQKYFDTEIEITNDANAAALGEAVYGAAKGCSDCVMITIGTGIGGGVILNGKIYGGCDGMGAELGHTTFVVGGRKCSCGRRGCAEQYVSATAFIRQTKSAMIKHPESLMWQCAGNNLHNVNGKTAFDCAKKGDEVANKVVNRFAENFASFLMNQMNVFRPQVIVIGGGISAEGEYFISKVESYCEKFNYGYRFAPKPQIVKAALGNDAGLIGAAELLRQ